MDGINPDIFKTMEQAMELSKLFNGGNTGDEAQGEPDERMNQVMDMINIMQMFKAMNTNTSQPPELKEDVFKTVEPKPESGNKRKYFDDEIHTPALMSIKAAIPYLESKYQKSIGIFIKLIEIQKMMEVYSHAAVSMQEQSGEDWRKGMLMAMRPHMDEDKRNMLEFLIRVIDLKEAADRITPLGASSFSL